MLLTLEGLEDRTVMSHVLAPPSHPAAQIVAAPKVTTNLSLNVTGVTNLKVNTDSVTGAITSVTGLVTGTLAGHAFSTPLTLTATPAASSTVPVLNLHLDAIHLNLLGLKVDTSPICLNITAHTGPGNLLGNLVGDVANLLNGPATATGLLNTLTSDLTHVASGLNGVGSSSILGLLNTALARPAAASVPATNVLSLSVGPLDLNLLGLEVALDNCSGGPVTVNISAQPGSGNLLGNLISSLSHLLDNPGHPVGGILSHLNQILGIARSAPPVV